MPDLSNNIHKTRVECYEEARLDKRSEFNLFLRMDDVYEFHCNDEVIVLKCSDFPEMRELNTLDELKKKIDELRENAQRVRVLKRKLESAEESYKEGINELKIKHDLEIQKLQNEKHTAQNDNKKLVDDLKKVNIRVNEINKILKDISNKT